MTPIEANTKTKVWFEKNKEYLEEEEAKKEREAKEKEENINKPEKKKRKSRKQEPIHAVTAGEAMEKMLHARRISTKINYDVLRNLNSDFEMSKIVNKSSIANGASTSTAVLPEETSVIDIEPEDQVAPVNTRSKKRKLEVVELEDEEPVVKQPIATNDIIIVEEGPIAYDQDQNELDDEDDEDYDEADADGYHGGGAEDYYGDDGDEYYD